MSLRTRLKSELEAPAESRRLGSGWIAGTLALAAAVAGLGFSLVLRHPTLFSVPELATITAAPWFRLAVQGLLVMAFLLSSLNLMLRPQKTLGLWAIAITLLASLIGSLPSSADPGNGVYFGLDFFVLNVLFCGFLFIPIERIVPRAEGQPVLRAEWKEDLFYYLVSSLLVQVLALLTLAPSKLVNATAPLTGLQAFASGLPFIVQLLLIMLITDLVQYAVHRLFHVVPFLWRFHAVHHSAKSLDWIAGARMHFIEIVVLRAATATPAFVIGFDIEAIQAYLLIVYVYSTFIHSNLGVSFRWLEPFMVTPRFHHWHHGIETEAIDVNFAIHFPWIDKAFGTHHMPDGRWPSGYGVGGHPVPLGYVKQFLYPFRRQ
jgi:sterol desaturase/sphingolipid hydroxylase (fatty acid hydroxylase superfamily)